jgi:hypothetical protein
VRGIAYAVAGIVIAALFSFVIPISIARTMHCSRVAVCMSNLHQLGLAVNQYAKVHEGCLPAADKWCDLLMESDPSLSRRIFECPTEKGMDLPNDVVLLFEADGGWNVSGGQELLTMRHKGRDRMYCSVLLCNFSVRSWPELTEEKSLRWDP